jgi:hypothetical protein
MRIEIKAVRADNETYGGFMFEKEEAFYEAHKEDIRAKYTGKRVLIAGQEIKGVFDSDGEAYRAAIETMKPGDFMIKPVTRTDDESVCRYRSRVYV